MKILLRSTRIALLILGAVLTAAQPASAAVRFRGGFFVGPAIRPWGWYAPYYYGPYGPYAPFGPYGFYGPYGYPNAGEVKLHTNVKDAQVFINGSYAGTAGKLKTMWLRPNTYDLEIRAPDGAEFTERIYVVAGKTVNVHADLHMPREG
jgi:hypothetical protein